jgi:uncharacterized membrane-anchored protein YitT (DUF2179 family)
MRKRFIQAADNADQVRKLILKRYLKDFFLISLGVFMASVGLKGFLLPNNFLDGGAMGVSLLLQIITNIELSYLIILVNLPFIILGAKQISYEFAFKSILAIVALSILVHIINLPTVTEDKLLIAVFGGFFLGSGIGFTIRGGAVIDGTEVLGINFSKKGSITVGDFIAIFNVILFAVAILLINIETAMYSMLTYLSASKTVDFIINGVDEYIGVMIISNNHEAIKEQIIKNVKKGVTVLKAEKGFGSTGDFKSDTNNVLYCVITRLEVSKLLLEIEKVDRAAFIVQHKLKDIKGGMVRKKPLH